MPSVFFIVHRGSKKFIFFVMCVKRGWLQVQRPASLCAFAGTPRHSGSYLLKRQARHQSSIASPNLLVKHAKFWDDVGIQRQFMAQVAQHMGVTKPEDWYGVSRQAVAELTGDRLFLTLSPMVVLLRNVHPDYPWDLSKFQKKRGHTPTLSIHRQQELLTQIGRELGVINPSGWYTVSKFDVIRRGGGGVLSQYPSYKDAIMALFPHQLWNPNKFVLPSVPRDYWRDITNQRARFTEIEKALGITQPEQWYKVSHHTVVQWGGAAIMSLYSSLEEALRVIFPEVPWVSSRFRTSAKRSQDIDADGLEKLEGIGKELGIKQLHDWYAIDEKAVVRRGGRTILRQYRGLDQALRAAYPDFAWNSSLFIDNRRQKSPDDWQRKKKSAGYWENPNNILRILGDLEQRLAITQPEDWYSINLTDIRELGFPTRMSRRNLAHQLAMKYPHQSWDKFYLLHGRFTLQRKMETAVRTLFPTVDVIRNARKEADLISPTGQYLELDLFLPSLKLAFEFQEKHHYVGSPYSYEPLDLIQERDRMKQELAEAKGITVIIVPYWWDGKLASLAETVRRARPDSLEGNYSGDATAIPSTIPETRLGKEKVEIPDLGEPTSACFLTRSHDNVEGWWLFEKYDGVRGFWNPRKRKFYSRLGSQLAIPQHIIDIMPSDVFLDGELWFGRDSFQEAMKISARADPEEIDWTAFNYMVFDIPNHAGTFQERYADLEARFGEGQVSVVRVPKKEVCRDMQHLEEFFQDIIDGGGEGIILRDPMVPLRPGRCPGYLKHKKFRDGEARVIGSQGTHQWECELPNGVRFVAQPGTTEFARRWNPRTGDIVSFKHRGFLLKTHKPKMPLLYRVRPDLSWDIVVRNWNEKKPRPPTGRTPLAAPSKPKGYWRSTENRRQFFIEFAGVHGFDPFDPANWANVTALQIRAEQGQGLLKACSNKLSRALRTAFPELQFRFEEWTLARPPRPKKPNGYWLDQEARRKYFIDFARKLGFDPFNPQNWMNITAKQIAGNKGSGLLDRFDGDPKLAIKCTFPELAFGFKGRQEADRELFNLFAAENGIDPFSPEAWYAVDLKELQTRREQRLQVEGDIKQALQRAYPEVQFERWQGAKKPPKWTASAACRAFFNQFAAESGLDPLDPESWYSVKLSLLVAQKGGSTLVAQHHGVKQALQFAYPEVDFRRWKTASQKQHLL